MSWLYLVLAILCEVGATMSLRASGGLRERKWIPAVVGGYVAAFVLLSFALGHGMALGVAYGIWAAAGVALTAVLARWLFREPLTRVMALGILLIAGGVLLVELGAEAMA
ncbi:QacE family quaternary ammonium compound efflux SMR transporter [Nakamurella sp. YIM 132087]|uniref:QacE family quaternary ammonium compound efflux SMR transporter n=1 Tax=Nakamurella alba TaxID=2665158 RepID=A0A7K1FHG8_9ACTN|nr:multidrug efflux SMR transporter [Nakamurella alba]MTD12899.1 QacE family quaternary ammonium compound efflux SMR transporter [Nakamurella alba]